MSQPKDLRSSVSPCCREAERYFAAREHEVKMQQAYEHALKLERDREATWRKTDQGAFESSMESLDIFSDSADDPGKLSAFTDHGQGARKIRPDTTEPPRPLPRRVAIWRAMNRLRHRPDLQRTLRLILRNGRHWEGSAEKLCVRDRLSWPNAVRLYRHRLAALLGIFCPKKQSP